ncbi:MAG: PilT/PilU family type 4a pilus ATPase, partial [Deltaproteobacteria bacterium]|nr:PilT/PilU family type 4a pilus ATPase [Deltaproteobacteria bacterium]
DFITISDLEFTIGKKIKPVIVPFFIMEAAHTLLSPDFEGGINGRDVEKIAMTDKAEAYRPPKISSLLSYLVKSGASDMLLTAGVPPSVKKGKEWRRLSSPSLTPQDCEAYATELLSNENWQKFQQQNEMEIGMSYLDIARLRITIYRQRNSIAIAIRHLYDKIPSFKELNLPDFLKKYALRHQGLIIIAGPAGSGKTTTLATIINIINTNRNCNIITLEEPIEFLHKHQKSNVNQREIGRDTESFEQGLRSIFRMAPDVIVIGELRDKESFEIALRAARTGHLVVTTMHAFDSTSVIRTMINMFPVEQQQLISMMLAESLLLSLYQRLIQKQDSTDMILATEKLTSSNRVKKFIWEGKIDHIRSQLEAGADEFTPIDVSLANLCKTGKIDFESGLLYSSNETLYRSLCVGMG